MGCTASILRRPTIDPSRRRLSLGEIGPGNDPAAPYVSETDRSLVMTLTQTQIMEFIAELQDELGFGAAYTINSETDKEGKLVQSFTSKSISQHGEPFNPQSEGVGFACKKGLKPEAPNQDSFFILKASDNYSLYGVFDGHGREGHDVSNFVKDNLPKILLAQRCLPEDPEAALTRTFEKVQYLIEKATAMNQLDAWSSGTTSSVVLHEHAKKMLYVAHVGDSRVVLGYEKQSKDGAKVWDWMDLTIDHKPDLPAERRRIEKGGGTVCFDKGWNHRVYARNKTNANGRRYPGLNMSRSMGDLSGSKDAGISAKPDVHKTYMAVCPQASGADDDDSRRPSTCSTPSGASISSCRIEDCNQFLCLCTDGVWEFITSEQAIKSVSKFSREDVEKAAENLAKMAWNEWIRETDGRVVDDITAVVIHL